MLDFSFTPHKKDYPAGSSPSSVYVFIAAPVPRRGAISELIKTKKPYFSQGLRELS
jgi:hypothetical protein